MFSCYFRCYETAIDIFELKTVFLLVLTSTSCDVQCMYLKYKYMCSRRQKKVPPFDPYNGRPFKKNGRRTGIERAMNGTARSVQIPV